MKHNAAFGHGHPRMRGMALMEALVASAVLGIGLAGATRLTLHALQTANDTRQHTVAHTLAVSALECIQAGRTDCALSASPTVQGITYTVRSQWQRHTELPLVDVEVRVQWPKQRLTPSGSASPTNSSGTSTAAAQPTDEIVWHTRHDEVPVWVGVSSP